MKKAQTIIVGKTYMQMFLQNEMELNYIKNVVISMSLKLNKVVNKDSNYVQDNCT